MILISSMGGCASTSLISWFSRRIECNCLINSEGLSSRGAGSNPKGLKHRIKPPDITDKYLLKENSFNRTDINYGPVERALFLYDNPCNIVPSLFNRRIASGHAMAITGKRPPHANDINSFISDGVDSFGFYDQFRNWSNLSDKKPYKRMLVSFSQLWNYLDVVLEFVGAEDELSSFPPKIKRKSSFDMLKPAQQNTLLNIYNKLGDDMNKLPAIIVI